MEELIKILEDLKPNVDFRTEKNLISDGKLTSLDIVQLIIAIRDEFDVAISPLNIVPENFESAETIYKLIEKMQDED